MITPQALAPTCEQALHRLTLEQRIACSARAVAQQREDTRRGAAQCQHAWQRAWPVRWPTATLVLGSAAAGAALGWGLR